MTSKMDHSERIESLFKHLDVSVVVSFADCEITIGDLISRMLTHAVFYQIINNTDVRVIPSSDLKSIVIDESGYLLLEFKHINGDGVINVSALYMIKSKFLDSVAEKARSSANFKIAQWENR